VTSPGIHLTVSTNIAIDNLKPKPLRCNPHAAGAPGTFVQGVNREAGATRAITLVKPGTAPATVNERGMDSVNSPCRMDQAATAPQAWEGGPSGAMPLMSPETDPAVTITVIDTVSRGVTRRCRYALQLAARPGRLICDRLRRRVLSSPGCSHTGTQDTRGTRRDFHPEKPCASYCQGQ
jgi:hypothetical protein